MQPRTRTTIDLLRLMVLCLTVALLAQGLLAAQARGHGPLHSHRAAAGAGHVHTHDAGERHVHTAGDTSVVALADALTDAGEPLDGAAFALVAMLALCALSGAWPGNATGRGVWRAAAQRTWRSRVSAPLLQPPRAA